MVRRMSVVCFFVLMKKGIYLKIGFEEIKNGSETRGIRGGEGAEVEKTNNWNRNERK